MEKILRRNASKKINKEIREKACNYYKKKG
jgi:hypothetical protein